MIEIITLGAGCFWCVEAVFSSLLGVNSVDVGYCNGRVENPSYEMVCSGDTGHAEVAQITFNTKLVSLEEILNLFFKSHDPTTMNKQGADIGTQYRSGIFYSDENQQDISDKVINLWNKSKYYDSPIVTEVTALDHFYIAENYHQNYYKNNKTAPYCRFVIKPKLDKLNQ
jgi:peptide-methionine (S)-S-oxide reductase